MLLYFRIADHYNITDHPNERSSHTHVTIRGGGIIFLFAAAVAIIWHTDYWLPIFGIFIIGIISFIDDQRTLSNKIRIVFHLIAVTLLFIYLHLFSTFPVYGSILLYILAIGIINAFNFMDGINGITGAYSLIVLGGLQYINLQQIHFVDPDLIWLPMLACFVFLYYNFRKKAKCFAGDVGSVTIAFWIIVLLLDLILTSNNWTYILFLAVYGVDTVLTIIHRLWLRQNIFKAHRFHFFQLLANEQKIPHLLVSFFYAVVQLLIIIWIIKNPKPFWLNFIITCIPLIVIYVSLKSRLMKHKQS
jgi:UDP-N-acetylmuramyl pentapeptide phosphotransferase/UDP-N-acetylglucosamine-1-phosphate transferase